MPRLRVKSRRTIEKEKEKEKDKLPPTGDYWDANPKYLRDIYSEKIIRVKRVYICKICGKRIGARQRTHSHKRKRIKLGRVT